MSFDLTGRGVFDHPFTWEPPFVTSSSVPPNCYMPKKMSYLLGKLIYDETMFSNPKYPWGDWAFSKEFYARNLALTNQGKNVWGAWALNVEHCVESARGIVRSNQMYVPYVNFNGSSYSFDFSYYSNKNEIRAAYFAMMGADVSWITSQIFNQFPYYVAHQGTINPNVGDEIEKAYGGFQDYVSNDPNPNALLDTAGVIERWERLNRDDFSGGQTHRFQDVGIFTYLDLFSEVQFIANVTNATNDSAIQGQLKTLYERIQALLNNPSLRHGRGFTWIRYSNSDTLWYCPVPGNADPAIPATYNWSEPIYGSRFHIPRNVILKPGPLPNSVDVEERLPPFSARFTLAYETQDSNDATNIIVKGGPETSTAPPWGTKLVYESFTFPGTYLDWRFDYAARGPNGRPAWNGFDPKQPDSYGMSGAFSSSLPQGLSILYASSPSTAVYNGKHWGYIRDRTSLQSPESNRPFIGDWARWISDDKRLEPSVRLSEFWWMDSRNNPDGRWHTGTSITMDPEPRPSVEPVPSTLKIINLRDVNQFVSNFNNQDGFERWFGYRLKHKDVIVALSNKIVGEPYDAEVDDSDKVRFKAAKLYTALGRKTAWPNTSFNLTVVPNYEIRQDYGYILTETYDFLRSSLGLNHSYTSPLLPNEVESRFVTWLRPPFAPSRTVIRCLDSDAPWYPLASSPPPNPVANWTLDPHQWFTGATPGIMNNPANVTPFVLVDPHPYPVEIDRTLLFIDPAYPEAFSDTSIGNGGTEMLRACNVFAFTTSYQGLSWYSRKGVTIIASFLMGDTLEESLLCMKTMAELDRGALVHFPPLCFLPSFKIGGIADRPDPYDLARYVAGILTPSGSILSRGVPFSVEDPRQASIPFDLGPYNRELSSRSAYESDPFWIAVQASTVKEYLAFLLNPGDAGARPLLGPVQKVNTAPHFGSIKFACHHQPANSPQAVRAARLPTEIGRFDSTWQVKMKPGSDMPDWPPYRNDGLPAGKNYIGGQLADLFRICARSVVDQESHRLNPPGRFLAEIFGTWSLDGLDVTGASLSSQTPGLGRGGMAGSLSSIAVFGLNAWYNNGSEKDKPIP